LRDGYGSGHDGVSSTVEPEPGGVHCDGDSPVYANSETVSQAEKGDAARDYRRHDLDTTLGRLVRIPPADYEKRLKRFRRDYGRIVEMARDPRAGLEIREAFSKLWNRWRRRSVANYPESLRDQIFA
jgi:hypothetical protein